MFLPFFHTLRGLGVPVSPTEWLTLLDGVSKGLHKENLDDFYLLARCLLVKDPSHYDAFDQAFAHCFQDASLSMRLAGKKETVEWLREQLAPLLFSVEELARLKSLGSEELLRELELRLRAQDDSRQAGLKGAVRSGISPSGQQASTPSGSSFSDERGGGGRGTLPAFGRRYRNLRNDLTLDVRQIGVALKRLRDLRDTGAEDTLDLEASIEKTCRNGGEIDLVFGRERKNQVRLLLVMDSGGSMEPYRILSERLFSAANRLNYFKKFRAFYFHNCVYERLYTNLETGEYVPTAKVLREYAKEYRLLIVGDAAMAPFELQYDSVPLEDAPPSANKGIDWLRELGEAFPRRAWLNPLAEDSWSRYETVSTVAALFPMFPLTLDGLTQGVRRLLK